MLIFSENIVCLCHWRIFPSSRSLGSPRCLLTFVRSDAFSNDGESAYSRIVYSVGATTRIARYLREKRAVRLTERNNVARRNSVNLRYTAIRTKLDAGA